MSKAETELGDPPPRVPDDFQRNALGKIGIVRITEVQMDALAKLADHHAEIEIANHLSAFTNDGPWLEWFDAPGDPISISLTIPEANVLRFAGRIGARWGRDEGSPLPSRKG